MRNFTDTKVIKNAELAKAWCQLNCHGFWA
jgi:hypothetical protein